MVLRIGGLASGMDIDSIVEKLMTAEKAPLNKLVQSKQKFEWQRDAYRDVNKKLKAFDDMLFSKMTLQKDMLKKTAISTSSAVSATATASASGSLSISGVSQLASSANAVGNTIVATGSTKLSDLGVSAGTIKLNAIQSDGKMLANGASISIASNETVSSFVTKLNNSNAGVTAVFENGKFSITAKNTGENASGGEITLDAAGVSAFQKLGFASLGGDGILANNGKNAVFNINGIATERSSNSFSINGYNITLKETFNSQYTGAQYTENLYNNYVIANNLANTANSNLATKQTNFNTAASGLESNTLSSLDDIINNDTALSSFLMNLGNDADNKLDKLISMDYTDGNTLTSSIEALDDDATFTATEVNTLKGLLVNAGSVTSSGNKLSVLSSQIDGTLDTVTEANAYLTANKELAVATAESQTAQTNLQSAKDSLNANLSSEYGYTYDFGADNRLENGSGTQVGDGTMASFITSLKNSATQSTPVTLTSSTDVDSMVKNIKEFVDTYNGLIESLNSLYKEPRYRDFAPLTDEQKADMSEKEIDAWETKAKSGILRGDLILDSALSKMRNILMGYGGGKQDNKATNENYINRLSEMGITTSNKTSERGKLQIDETKLRAAIESDPEQVFKTFSDTTSGSEGLVQKLRASIKSTTSSIEKKAGKDGDTNNKYNLGKSLNGVEDRITNWKDRLDMIEKRYWKQFTAMEQAVNKANSTSSSLFSSQSQQ